MKAKLFSIITLLISINIFSQEITQIDSKYLTALIYLKTNNNINKEIKKFRKHWIKKEKVKSNNIEEFNISKYISYLPIPKIEGNLDEDSLKIDSKLHREKYYFDLEENILFNKLIPKSNSKIYLLYSKPVKNYLIAEFMINITGSEIDMVTHKDGPAMHLLFIFDENNIVKNVYISRSYYH